MEYVDYYAELGIPRDAPQDEIGPAFKKLARKYHPDVNKEPGAEDRFKRIVEAHEVLKDRVIFRVLVPSASSFPVGLPSYPVPA